jgi:hypothetical protein
VAKVIIEGLRKDGVLSSKPFQTPIDFAYFDLWHYYGRTSKHGAFMGGSDFVQWHGNYPLLKHTVEIQAMAKVRRPNRPREFVVDWCTPAAHQSERHCDHRNDSRRIRPCGRQLSAAFASQHSPRRRGT